MKIPCFSQWSRCGWSFIHVIVVGVLSVLQLDAADAKGAAGADPVPTATFHKLRVEDNVVSQALQAKGARLIADYGSYQLLEMCRISGFGGCVRTKHFRYEPEMVGLKTLCAICL